eukprot:4548860-Prymnesium_polylepis.1
MRAAGCAPHTQRPADATALIEYADKKAVRRLRLKFLCAQPNRKRQIALGLAQAVPCTSYSAVRPGCSFQRLHRNLGIRVGACTAGVAVSTPSGCTEEEVFAQVLAQW